jgi:hypothetical protein
VRRTIGAVLLAAAVGCGTVDVPVAVENRDTKPRVISLSSFESRFRTNEPSSMTRAPECPAYALDLGPLAPGEVRETVLPVDRDGRVEISCGSARDDVTAWRLCDQSLRLGVFVGSDWIRSTERPADPVVVAELRDGWVLRVFRDRAERLAWYFELDETPSARALPDHVRPGVLVLESGRQIPLEFNRTIDEIFGRTETPSHVYARWMYPVPEDATPFRLADAKEFVFEIDGVKRRVPILTIAKSD